MHRVERASFLLGAVVFSLVLPSSALAYTGVTTVTGVVTRTLGTRVQFRASSAANYDADLSLASLTKRNGSPLSMGEIAVGDKIEVKGQVWQDNSISARSARDISLYPHSGTFNGKIASVDAISKTFVLQTGQYGSQTIYITPLTAIRNTGTDSTFQGLAVGMSATVKGVWERTRTQVVASQVVGKVRLVNITVTGEVVIKDSTTLTLTAGGVIYAVDAAHAKVLTHRGAASNISELLVGTTVKVEGKHITESTQVVATIIKLAQ